MRYLVISDIHGNIEALDAVLKDAPPYDAVLCLGDLVGYGPNPNDVVRRIRDLSPLATLAGNHDWAALGKIDLDTFNAYAAYAAEWTGSVLAPEVRAFLDSLSPRVDLPDLTLAHGSPRDPIWEYLDSPAEAPTNFAAFDTQLCFVGHTHIPMIMPEQGGRIPELNEEIRVTADERLILNPGSVGQPRDDDPRAAYASYDDTEHMFRFHRVAYDVETTQRNMQAAGLPWPLALRLSVGL